MNKKYIIKNNCDNELTFVLSGEKEIDEQLLEVFAIEKGYGFTVEHSAEQIKIVDYFHGETRAAFEIISIEDTSEDVCYLLLKL